MYAVSAGCIMVGIAQILLSRGAPAAFVDPKIAEQQTLEKFYGLVTLSLYEAALLAVAMLILLARRVYDDAIALTLLIAIFLVGTTVALDTVAPDFPDAVLLFGLAGLCMACAKLLALRQYILHAMPAAMLVGLLALMIWNCLMPAALSHVQAAAREQPNQMYHMLGAAWLVGWYATLLGGGLLVLAAMSVSTGDAGVGEAGEPFLHSSAMRWIVAGIVFAGTIAHHAALMWAFNLRIVVGDLLPAAGLITLAVLEITRGYGYRFNIVDAAVLSVPMVLTAWVFLSDGYTMTLAAGFGAVSSPGVFLSLFAVALLVVGSLRDRRVMRDAAAGYAIVGVLMLGEDPLLQGRGGWLLVALSFFILGIGAVASLRKGRRVNDAATRVDGEREGEGAVVM